MQNKKLFYILLLLFLYQITFGKVGLVLSGGGARGIAHIGVLKRIDELNIKIDYIAGTSMGAVIGALYAQGYSAEEIETFLFTSHFEKVFQDKVKRKDLYVGEKRWLPSSNYYFNISDRFRLELPKSFFLGNRLTNKLFDFYFPSKKYSSYDDLQIPFRCVATDIVTGEIKIFSSGSLHETVRASMSVPSIIAPFELDNAIYIDGGIRANFPTEVVKEMGADTIIGVKVNTGLRTEEELNSLLKIYDQTVNITITDNVEKSMEYCDIIIEPDLDDIDTSDFTMKKEIVCRGEEAAELQFLELSKLPKKSESYKVDYNKNISFSKIKVIGNSWLSDSKIKEFVGLKLNNQYNKDEILQAIEHAYCSKLFDGIYPIIEEKNKLNILTLKILEARRRKLGIGVGWSEENDLIVSTTLEMNNVIQRNSKFLLNAKIGGKQELNIDYVKNYGKFYGAYFRIFPYLREYKTYAYNEDHQMEKSMLSFESAATIGFGFFAEDAIVAEIYGYALHHRLYRHIAEFEDIEQFTSGIGIKLYHESLDDIIFPTQGASIFAKATTDRKIFFSDIDNYKLYSKILLLLPLGNFSVKYYWEYGAHLKEEAINFDPFYIGGINSFLGALPNEMNAPIFQINTIAISFQPIKNLFVDIQYNSLNFGENSDFYPINDENLIRGFGLKIGYKTRFIPIQTAIGFDEDFHHYLYFSIGYTFDEFFFSRK